jgi:hypothetical protein
MKYIIRAPFTLKSDELCNFLNTCRMATPLRECKAPSRCTNVLGLRPMGARMCAPGAKEAAGGVRVVRGDHALVKGRVDPVKSLQRLLFATLLPKTARLHLCNTSRHGLLHLWHISRHGVLQLWHPSRHGLLQLWHASRHRALKIALCQA